MSDFNAVLTRAFAEAHEPVDDGFSVTVAKNVARRELTTRLINGAQAAGMAAAGAAVFYGLWTVGSAQAPDLLASAGLELARAHGAISQAPVVATQATDFGATILHSLSAGLTQILLVTAALAGGAVAYRSTQE